MSDEWYTHLNAEEINGKHVRVRIDDGTMVESYLVYDDQGGCVRLGDSVLPLPWESKSHKVFPSPAVLTYEDDECLYPLQGVESIDLVWDERDWEQTDAKDLSCGDAVVSNGRLYKVRAMGLQDEHYPFVLADAPGRLSIDLRLVSCALRRRVQIPVKPGFYKDALGEFWARSAKSTEGGTWRSVEPDALDQPAKSDKYMSNLMPLTPVHFESGRAA